MLGCGDGTIGAPQGGSLCPPVTAPAARTSHGKSKEYEMRMATTDLTFGIHLPVRMLTCGEPEPPSANLLLDMVGAARDAGFGSVWVTDHVVFYDPWMDSMMALAVIAGKAQEAGMTIGTGILVSPARHPVALAQTCATLDILSGGNLVIGIGEGSTSLDFDAMGLAFDQRRKMLADGAVALRKLLSGTNVSHRGPCYNFENVTVAPRSIQQPCPPIWLSSWGSDPGISRVARLGDGWVASVLNSTPEKYHSARVRLNKALEERGKDPTTFPDAVDTMFTYVDPDRMRAREIAKPIIEASTWKPFEMEGEHYLVGDYDECEEILRRWIDAGARHICLWPVIDPVEQIRRLGQSLLPRF